MNLEYLIKEEDEKLPLKIIINREFQLSSRLFSKLKRLGCIRVNDEVAYVNNTYATGNTVTICFDYDEEDEIIAQEGNLEVLYEDDWYLAVNKPSNMVVHPCSYHPNGTLANYVKYYLHNNKKIHPVNRLDNGTSGIVLFAKNEYAQEKFKELDSNNVTKEYIALVEGILEEKEGTINLPIARKEGSIIERCVDFENGLEAITNYNVLKEIDGKYSLLSLILKTGRTHQIRVHMAYLGHPLVGDTLYNFTLSSEILRQALHAYKLSFKHPIYNKKIEIIAEIPTDIKRLI